MNLIQCHATASRALVHLNAAKNGTKRRLALHSEQVLAIQNDDPMPSVLTAAVVLVVELATDGNNLMARRQDDVLVLKQESQRRSEVVDEERSDCSDCLSVSLCVDGTFACTAQLFPCSFLSFTPSNSIPPSLRCSVCESSCKWSGKRSNWNEL